MRPRVVMLSLSADLTQPRAAGLSEAQARHASYADSCRSLHIVVRTPAGKDFRSWRVADNLTVEATNTRTTPGGLLSMLRRTRRAVRERHADLIVAQDCMGTGIVGLLLSWWYGKALCVHYLCDLIDNPEWLRERVLNRALNRVGKLVLRHATIIRTDSPDEVRKLTALGISGARIRYIPFLQEGLERFSEAATDARLRGELLGGEGEAALVLWVGRLEPQKGLDTLVDVASSVHRVRPDVRFVVIGDGSRRGELEARLAGAGLRDIVRLAGWIDFAELPRWFASTDLFLATSRYETAARVLVLARAAGLPVVTTDVSGAPDFARESEGGGVARVGDAAALADLVLARLGGLTAARAAAARTRAARIAPFARTNVVAQMAGLYRDALAPGSEAPPLCFVLPEYDSDTDGHFLHTYRLLDALARDTRLTVIVERARTTPELAAANVRVQRWAEVPPLRLVEIGLMCLRARRAGCRHFYVHYSFFGVIAAWLVTRLLGGRVFYWHCVSEVFQKHGLGREALTHRVKAEWPLRLAMRLTDRVVTGTAALRTFYAKTFWLPEERILVVPNDIDAGRFADAGDGGAQRAALGIEPSEQVVLFVHRLARRKGAHHLPAIARAVVERAARTRFVIVGDGPERLALSQTVQTDPVLRRHVVLTGKVANRAAAAYFGLADAFVMPSEEEGFPRVLLEAMAAGLPFVASDVGGVRELCTSEQHWGLVPAGDVEGAAAKLVALLGDGDLRRRLAEVGRRQVRRFGVERVAQATLAALGLGVGEVPPAAAPQVEGQQAWSR